MISKIILGVIVGAIGTNVAAKTVIKTGGSNAALGFLALGAAGNVVTFLTKPFWADLKREPVASPRLP